MTNTVFHNFGVLQWQMFSDISCTVHTPKKAILKPEAILEKGDHEGGCDYGPSQPATIWLSITHHHLPLNCCRFSGIQSQKLDISQFINFVFQVCAFLCFWSRSCCLLPLSLVTLFSSCVLPLCLGAGGPTAPGELGVHLSSNSL